ncbi:MAG TPA: hypothetical protein VLI93_07765 [Acetobacteraceae bacterium]|nr:hypothetical protein [Acetobacteraceae bacterium]
MHRADSGAEWDDCRAGLPDGADLGMRRAVGVGVGVGVGLVLAAQ